MTTKKIDSFILTLIFVCFACTIFFSHASAGSIVIVQNHNPKAQIVLPVSASEQIQNSAKISQQYIQNSTAALIIIRSDNNDSQSISIHTGLT